MFIHSIDSRTFIYTRDSLGSDLKIKFKYETMFSSSWSARAFTKFRPNLFHAVEIGRS